MTGRSVHRSLRDSRALAMTLDRVSAEVAVPRLHVGRQEAAPGELADAGGGDPSIAAVSFAEDLGGLRVAEAIDRTLRRTPQHRTPHSAHRSRIAAYGAGQSRRRVSRRDIVTSSVHILVIPSLTRR